jgi:hypothetical protein
LRSSTPARLPSLGWELLEWLSDVLPSPSDPEAPLVFTPEQAALIVRWYAVDDRGRFLFRRGCSRRSKGWGKSPVEAAKAIAELAGPVRFDGWDAQGQPVGRPWGTMGDPPAWVQIAAVSEDQTDNTYGALYEFLGANNGHAAEALGIDLGLTRCFLPALRGKLEPVTAAAGSREGQRVTYAVCDETHLWTPQNGGLKLARTLRRNVAKMRGRSYETTNSFAPGEHSVAEGTHRAWLEGAAGLFYDAVEAPEVAETDPDPVLKQALTVPYGDSTTEKGGWVDLDRLVLEVRDPETTWEDSQRYYFNRNVDDRHQAVAEAAWRALARPDVVVPAGAYIGAGFDGSISEDCTALIGCVLLDGRPHLFKIEVWHRPPKAPPGWRIPRLDVRARIDEAHTYWRVGQQLCDPAKWATEIEDWSETYNTADTDRIVVLDTNQPGRFWRLCDRFSTAVAEGAVTHDGSPELVDHVLAMHRRKVRVRDPDDDGRTKFVFVKGPDARKIDAGIGAVLALEAAMTMPADDDYDPLESVY